MVFDYQSHLPQYFITNFGSIHIHDVHILEYSFEHIDEVWINHSFSSIEAGESTLF